MGTWLTHLRKFARHSSVTAFALGAFISGCSSEQEAPPAEQGEGRETFDWERLSPEVAGFIKDNYLAHRSEFPDYDEPLPALQAFVQSEELLMKGQVEAAVALMEQAVADAPHSRHAQAGLGRALLKRHAGSGDRATLERAADALIQAHQLGLKNGRLRYTDEVARALGDLKDTARLAEFFEPLASRYATSSQVSLNYASGLARAGSPAAEAWYQRSTQLRETGDIAPAVEYAQWLLERDRAAEAYAVLEPREGEDFSIAHFFRGYAAEQLGEVGLAREAYGNAAGFSDMFPISSTWRTPLAAEAGIHFDNDVSAQTHCTGHTKMSAIIYCESRGEGTGGMRAVGWTIRSRVFLGTEKTGCNISNGGATTCDKYYSVGYQTSQFCAGTTRDATTDSIAYDVYYGRVPDPYAKWCPAGSAASTAYCTTTCSSSSSSGASVNGGTYFYATSGSCAATHPSGCGSTPAKSCGNGGSDHCFYRVP